MPTIIGSITNLLNSLANLLTWWVVISPWDEAVRVRLGKHLKVLQGGLHLRIPFIDIIYRQSIRLRILHLNTQTTITKDGKALTIGGTVGYSIVDILRLYQTLHNAQDTLMNLASATIAQCIHERDAVELSPRVIGDMASQQLNFEQYGLASAGVKITDFAIVKSYRLIQDQRSSYTTGIDTTMPL